MLELNLLLVLKSSKSGPSQKLFKKKTLENIRIFKILFFVPLDIVKIFTIIDDFRLTSFIGKNRDSQIVCSWPNIL